MPNADPDLVAAIELYSGKKDHSDLETYAINLLKKEGYRLERFQWHPKAGVTTYDDMSQEEYDCMCYLIGEWDWGGLIK